MKRILFTILFLAISANAYSADVVLQVTVPDAWVNPTIAAINSRFPGRELTGLTVKQWTEYQMRNWLKAIVVEHKNRTAIEAALAVQNYVEIKEDDVPITYSGE